jgi:hypothetical protein
VGVFFKIIIGCYNSFIFHSFGSSGYKVIKNLVNNYILKIWKKNDDAAFILLGCKPNAGLVSKPNDVSSK